jgi:hypothetical protein
VNDGRHALVRAGLADSARSLALRSRGNATIDPTRHLVLLEAIVHTLRGDQDEAFRLLSIYTAVNPQFALPSPKRRGGLPPCGAIPVTKRWFKRGQRGRTNEGCVATICQFLPCWMKTAVEMNWRVESTPVSGCLLLPE